MSVAVQIHNLTLSYRRRPAVHHVSGLFRSGSLTAVTGPNGAGKSTLLKGIAGLIAPSEGHIFLSGMKDGELAYLPQHGELAVDFPLSVLEMVSLGFWRRAGNARSLSSFRARAAEALRAAGMTGFEHRPVDTLSCGQMQRALFARVIAQDATLILLDEPFAAIDAETTEKLLAIMHRWHEEGRTVICVLHDARQIRDHFPQCLLLARECLSWGDTAEVMKGGMHTHFHEAWEETTEICPQ